jgi:hypothetical protein
MALSCFPSRSVSRAPGTALHFPRHSLLCARARRQSHLGRGAPHIGGISVECNEIPQKPRISRIRDSLSSRGVTSEVPYIHVKDGARKIYAYPDSICLAILEYYAFDAGSNCRDEARNNFRILAGKALQDFIYTQVGYSPNTTIPASWQQFHDRVTLAYHTVPHAISVFSRK